MKKLILALGLLFLSGSVHAQKVKSASLEDEGLLCVFLDKKSEITDFYEVSPSDLKACIEKNGVVMDEKKFSEFKRAQLSRYMVQSFELNEGGAKYCLIRGGGSYTVACERGCTHSAENCTRVYGGSIYQE